MRFNRYENLVDAEKDLKKRGFSSSFQLTDKKKMQCLENGKIYTQEDMRIVEYHRFEGESNPSDLAVIFAVTCRDKTRGTVVSSYGPYADLQLSLFMDKVKIVEQQNI